MQRTEELVEQRLGVRRGRGAHLLVAVLRRVQAVNPLLPLIAVLLGIAVVVWIRAADEYRRYAEAKRLFEARRVPPPFSLSLSSYSPAGQPVLRNPADGGRLFALFVLRRSQEAEDLSLWKQVAAATADPGIVFVGCCADQGCVSRLKDVDAGPLVVASDVPYFLGRSLGAAAARERFVVLDRLLTVVADPPIATRDGIVAALKKAAETR
jgi:hypothetical protein